MALRTDVLPTTYPTHTVIAVDPRQSHPEPSISPALPIHASQGVDRSPFSLYGYAFYRANGDRTAVAGTAYGGSQASAIAGYRVSGTAARPVELIARLSYSPDDPASTEPAIGLRWTAARGLSLAAEYRRRADGTGTAIAYAAGGTGPLPLPQGFALETYAQAGVYEQDGVHGFYDAQISTLRPVATLGDVAVRGGVGAWSGGTDEIQRLDIGPRLSATSRIGKVGVTLHADYRFRVAGSAAPGSGPAMTLAAGF